MSQDIINEVYFLGGSLLMGIVITFAYDFILIGRRIVRHSLFFISFEDFFFWVACAIVVFYMLYKENNGVLRWFAVLGAAIGMALYKKAVGNRFVKMVAILIQKEIYLLRKIAGIVFWPFGFVIKKGMAFLHFLGRKEKRFLIYMKKKLTGLRKALRIVRYKH